MKNPCLDCSHSEKGECDILGAVTKEKLKQCTRAGYKEFKTLYANPLRGHHKRGAYWSAKDTDGRMG